MYEFKLRLLSFFRILFYSDKKKARNKRLKISGLLKRLLKNYSEIWFKVSVVFVLMGIIPISLLSVLYFNQMRKEVYTQANSYSAEILRGVSENLGREMAALENISIDIAYAEDVQHICVSHDEMSIAEINELSGQIRMNIAFKLSHARDVTDVYLYTLDEERYVLFGDERFKFNLKEEYEEALLKESYLQNGHTVISSFSAEQQIDGIRKNQDEKRGIDKCILISRAARSLSTGEILGVVIMRVSESMLAERLESVDIGINTEIVIYDDHYGVVSSTNSGVFAMGAILPNDIINASDILKARTLDDINLKGTYSIVDMPLENMEWRIIALISRDAINSRLSIVFVNLFFLLIPICIAVIIGNHFFCKILAKPLNELVFAMKLAETGDLEICVDNNSPDEIGRAARSFNRMIERIRQLLEDIKNQEKGKRHAEFAALRAQINLHFLSNTLNTARCMAQMQKADNIEKLLTSLIELLHISMDLKNDLIVIKEELNYISRYIDIMQYRNYIPIDIIFEIQPDIEDSLVPKLILQPILENALTYGFTSKKTDAQIIIKASGNDNQIRITITDNGQGIKSEEIEKILKEDKTSKGSRFSGIGLSNVNQRIKLLFGNKYGIHVESIYQMYTTVVFELPNLKGGNLEDKADDSR